METYQYMKMTINFITEDIKKEYDIFTRQHNGFIYIEIRKGMYCLLPSTRKLCNKLHAGTDVTHKRPSSTYNERLSTGIFYYLHRLIIPVIIIFWYH